MSFRHRAQDQLRAVGCPQRHPLGHFSAMRKRTIAEGYGEGFPVTKLLKKWIDKIGF